MRKTCQVALGLLLFITGTTQAQFTYETNGSTIVLTQYTGSNGAVTISNFVTVIGSNAFSGSGSLTNVTIPESVTNIGDHAFFGCSGLKSIVIPDSVTSIGDLAFCECSSLTNLTISAGVTNIGADSLFEDFSLFSINVSPFNPAYSSVNGVLFDKSLSTLIQYPGNRMAKNYIVPNGVTSIADDAFFTSSNLASLTIPASVTNIAQEAFAGCVWLQGLYFLGDSPSGSWTVGLPGAAGIYHLPGTTGFSRGVFWTLPYPVILQETTNFGAQPSGFSFTVSWASNAAVIVAASTNLAAANWQPLQTNILVATNGVWFFSDPEWTNYPARFYRITTTP